MHKAGKGAGYGDAQGRKGCRIREMHKAGRCAG